MKPKHCPRTFVVFTLLGIACFLTDAFPLVLRRLAEREGA